MFRDWGVGSGEGEKWMLGYFLEVEVLGFAEGLGLGYRKIEGLKIIFGVLVWVIGCYLF